MVLRVVVMDVVKFVLVVALTVAGGTAIWWFQQPTIRVLSFVDERGEWASAVCAEETVMPTLKFPKRVVTVCRFDETTPANARELSY